MAKVDDNAFPGTRGKVNKKSSTVYRIRNGEQQSYTLSESSVPPSKAQKAHRKLFGKVTALVNAIVADPQQNAEWDRKRLEYNQSVAQDMTARRYKTTRSYAHAVISAQLAKAESRKRRKNPLPKTLPKGLKLHIRHFADLSNTELYEILKARFAVFYLEQNIRYQDFDGIDYNAIHLALHRKGHVLAYARLFKGKERGRWILGRMLTTEREKGHGRYILLQAISEAERQGAKSLVLHAQTQVVPFYEKFGFETSGKTFMEADIPHITMIKKLTE